jgi:hypothetical protein
MPEELRAESDSGWAIWGGTVSGTGVVGTAGGGVGSFGESKSSYGVWGRSTSSVGVVGDSAGQTPAVWGHNRGSGVGVAGTGAGGSPGVAGQSGDGRGVQGEGRTGVFGTGTDYGVFASSQGRSVVGYGGVGVSGTGTHGGAGVFGTAEGGGKGGIFNGGVDVVGDLTMMHGDQTSKIDHPVDPENKYLLHSSVASSERKQVYDGVAQLDQDGAASVELPEWFEALNEAIRYQLTPVGGPAPNLHVATEMRDNRFRIAGGAAGMTVCWQVTGTRRDRWAGANPFAAEQDKPEEERGRFLRPELFGAPEEQRIPLGPEEMTGPEEADLRSLLLQRGSLPPPASQPPGLAPRQEPTPPVGASAPGFDRLGALQQRQIAELTKQIEELRRQR